MQKAGSNNSNGNIFSKNNSSKINQFLNEKFDILIENKNKNKKKELTNKRQFRDNEFKQYVKKRNVDLNERLEQYIAKRMSNIKPEKMLERIKKKKLKNKLFSPRMSIKDKNGKVLAYKPPFKTNIEIEKNVIKNYKNTFKKDFYDRKLNANMNDYEKNLKNNFWPKSPYSINKSQTYTQWQENQKRKYQSFKRTNNNNNNNNNNYGLSSFNNLSIYDIPKTISLYKENNIKEEKKPSFFGSIFRKTPPTLIGGNGKKRSVKKPSIKKASSKKTPLKKSSSKKPSSKK